MDLELLCERPNLLKCFEVVAFVVATFSFAFLCAELEPDELSVLGFVGMVVLLFGGAGMWFIVTLLIQYILVTCVYVIIRDHKHGAEFCIGMAIVEYFALLCKRADGSPLVALKWKPT